MNKKQFKLFELALRQFMVNLVENINQGMREGEYMKVELSAKVLRQLAMMLQDEVFQSERYYNQLKDDDEVDLYGFFFDEAWYPLLYDLCADSHWGDDEDSNVGVSEDTFHEVNQANGNICSDEEVEGLLKELKEIYEEICEKMKHDISLRDRIL